METKFTKGEWKLDKQSIIKNESFGYQIRIYNENYQESILELINAWGNTKEEAEANAKLIAAAPDLLNSLVEFIDISRSNEDFNTKTNRMVWALRNGKQAIQKATE